MLRGSSQVPLCGDQNRSIEDCGVAVDLRRETVKRVGVALNLDSDEVAAYDGDVGATRTVPKAELVDNEGARVPMLARQALAVVRVSNVSVVHGHLPLPY